MLLQIHEPGQTPLPHQGEEMAIGIDLGTTNSLVAYSSEEKPFCIEDKNGEIITRSIIYIDDKNNLSTEKRNDKSASISSFKRLIGLGVNDLNENLKNFGYDINFENSDRIIRLKLGNTEVTPIEASAEILKKLKIDAENKFQKKVTKAVITVPAYFNDAQRQATKDAAKIAGLEVLRLINEPTSAALAYGLDKQSEGVFAIYDLGGGTFDVSVLQMKMGVFKVIATGGDTLLGGDDFDSEIAKFIKQKYNLNNPVSELKETAKILKESLLDKNAASIKFGSLEINLQALEFEKATENLVNKTIQIFTSVLDSAKITPSELNGTVLVGGSTRLNIVHKKLTEFLGKQPLSDINPDTVVALGAAIQAETLTRGTNNLLLDVTPLSLGLETYGGLMEVLIPRNSPIPAIVSQKFTTYEDAQTAMKIHVLQGERELAKNCRSLAVFDLRGIPPMPSGTAVIEISFILDADGILTVKAKEETTGKEQIVEVKPSYGLNSDEIEKILITSMEQAKEDITERLIQESKIEAEINIKNLKKALEQDGHLIPDEYLNFLENQIKKLQNIIKKGNREEIDIGVHALNKAAQDFADLRVGNAVKNYISGKKVGEV